MVINERTRLQMGGSGGRVAVQRRDVKEEEEEEEGQSRKRAKTSSKLLRKKYDGSMRGYYGH